MTAFVLPSAVVYLTEWHPEPGTDTSDAAACPPSPESADSRWPD
jgi:hypothetical protein